MMNKYFLHSCILDQLIYLKHKHPNEGKIFLGLQKTIQVIQLLQYLFPGHHLLNK